MQSTYIACSHKQRKEATRIESLAVSTRYRGKKIGDKLLDYCIGHLLRYRKTIALHVRQKNEVAYTLYMKYPNINIAIILS